MNFRTLAAGCLLLTACGAKPQTTDYNLDFEYTTGKKLPARWGIADQTFHGYASSSDFKHAHSGHASLRMEQVDSTKSGWAIFYRDLPGKLVAGHEVRLSGWIRTQQVDGFADLYLLPDEQTDYNLLSFDDGQRGVRETTEWTRISVGGRIAEGSSDITFGGLVKGGGKVWFDDLELTIDGQKISDTLIPSTKTRLTSQDKAELREYIYPLHSLDPANPDLSDLKILDRLVGDSRVVALGENSHGSAEIFRLKDRMVRYLFENKGFNILSTESQMAGAWQVDNYIDGRISDAQSPLMAIGATEQMLHIVQWMRRFHADGHPAAFAGFDMQDWFWPVHELKSAFTDNPGLDSLFEKMERRLVNAFTYETALPEVDKAATTEIASGLETIQEQIETSQVAEQEKAWLRQCVTLLRQYLGQGTLLWRDRCMAENLLWIKEQHPSSRIVVWAHNGHIEQRGGMMGEYLEERLDSDYVTFGFTFSKGSYTGIRGRNDPLSEQKAERACAGTLEYLLEKLGEQAFILDLKKMREDKSPILEWIDELQFRHVGIIKLDNEFPDRGISDAFDYLVFVGESTPAAYL